MEKLIQIADDRLAVALHSIGEGRRHGARRSQQSFNKPAGLLGVQLESFALADDLPGDLAGVNDHEFGHRTAFKGGRFLKKLFIRRCDTGDKPVAFGFFCDRLHARNVCLRGAHRKLQMFACQAECAKIKRLPFFTKIGSFTGT